MNFILKDWKEMYRNKLLLSSVLLICSLSFFVMRQITMQVNEVSFSNVLVPLFQVNVYLIPLLSMIVSSFSILQENTQRTLPILITRYYSPSRFIIEKSISAHVIMGAILFISNMMVLAISRFYMNINSGAFLYYLLSVFLLSAIFTQAGCLLGVAIRNKIQLLSYILLIWFFFVFIYDLILMYFIPNLQMNEVMAFSLFYFLSPLNAIRYFLFVKAGIYQLSGISSIYDHLTFQNPTAVLLINVFFWICMSLGLSFLTYKIRGAGE